MIRKLLATTALASVIATTAFAQTATTTASGTTAAMPVGGYLQRAEANQYLVSQLDGLNVYAGTTADAASAGEIENFVVGKDGKVLAAVIDTAGLDDDKTVAVPFDKLTWSMDQNNAPRAVLTATREELAAAPEFSDVDTDELATTGAMAPATGTAMTPATGTATTDTAMAPATTTAPPSTTTAAAMPVDANGYLTMATVGQYLTDDIIGEKVYSGPAENAASVGDVNDLVLGKNGQVAAAVIGVGGFLGLGEKNVAVPFAELQMAMDEDGDDMRAVLAATKEQLTAAPTFETRSVAQTAANTLDNGVATTGAALGTVATTADNAMTSTTSNMADATTTASTTTDTGRAAMTAATGAELTSERLVGTTVYGPNDESIGKVGDIALTAQGQVDAVIIDVGGFLGLGKKPVAVAMDNLQFMKDAGGSLFLYTQFTEDQLKAAPEFNRDTYVENRATMRILPGATLPSTTNGATTAPAQ